MSTSVKPITGRQKEALDFISSFIQKKGYAPSLRELASFLKTDNLSTAQYFVKQLEERGYLKREYYKSRGITPVTKKQTVSLLGNIAAGEPIEPIENPESVEVPSNIKLNPIYSYYALRVKGDSMIDMGVLDNDLVVIKHQMSADIGDVVVAITEKGATLKVFQKKNGRVILEPKNPKHAPIIPKQLEIRGILVGLIRANQ